VKKCNGAVRRPCLPAWLLGVMLLAMEAYLHSIRLSKLGADKPPLLPACHHMHQHTSAVAASAASETNRKQASNTSLGANSAQTMMWRR